MGTITPVTTYPDGQVLNPSEHNRNVYSETAGEGILSEANGNLAAANLDGGAAFTFEAEHLYPEGVFFARQESSREAVQTFGDVFGGTIQDQDDVGVSDLRALPGCSIRIYLPYAATVLWQWSYFVAPQRWWVLREIDDVDTEIEGLAMTGVRRNGNLLQHTIRPLPVSLALREEAAGVSLDGVPSAFSSRRVFSYAGRNAVWRDMVHLDASLSAGWHDLEVCLYLENMQRTDPLGEDLPSIFALRQEAGGGVYRAFVTNAGVFGVKCPRALIIG